MLTYLLLIYLFNFTSGYSYFCDLKCDLFQGELLENTVCMREPCEFGTACGKGPLSLPLDDNARQLVLDVHNKFRNVIALGLNTTGGNSKASNMRALSYDKELEFVAQCWSQACPPFSKPHDKCRRTSRFEYAGQNMYGSSIRGIPYSKRVEILSKDTHLLGAVNAWYNEITLMDETVIDSFHSKPYPNTIGHFTQVVWADTARVGCGRTIAEDATKLFVYCNYGDTGNIQDFQVYKRGKPCSECGGLACNNKFKGLCGEDSVYDDWKAPFDMFTGPPRGQKPKPEPPEDKFPGEKPLATEAPDGKSSTTKTSLGVRMFHFYNHFTFIACLFTSFHYNKYISIS